MNEIFGNLDNDMFSFGPEFLTSIVLVVATVSVFRLAIKLNKLFSRGFMFIGYGMVFLSAASIFRALSDIPMFDKAIIELLSGASILTTALCILYGVRKMQNDVIGKQKEVVEPIDEKVIRGEIK